VTQCGQKLNISIIFPLHGHFCHSWRFVLILDYIFRRRWRELNWQLPNTFAFELKLYNTLFCSWLGYVRSRARSRSYIAWSIWSYCSMHSALPQYNTLSLSFFFFCLLMLCKYRKKSFEGFSWRWKFIFRSPALRPQRVLCDVTFPWRCCPETVVTNCLSYKLKTSKIHCLQGNTPNHSWPFKA
jgi:hypothetical protein